MTQLLYSQVSTLSDVSAKSDLNDFGIGSNEHNDLAHDLRQPLSVIDSLAYYLELTCDDDKTRGHLRQIQAMVFEANRILCKHCEA